jgi:hypothetical protein
MHKRKDGQRALCSDYQRQRVANRLIYPRKSVAASGARVKRIACLVTGGFFMAADNQVKFQGFQFCKEAKALSVTKLQSDARLVGRI